MATEEKDEHSKISIDFGNFDPLGVKSAADISKDVVKFGLDGAKVFLNLTCKPLVEEFGLGLRDKFTAWRLNNIISMLGKAQGKIRYDLETETLKIDPRVAYQIIENVSTISDDNLQEMWAGLFASSCHTYEEDENIFFTDILKRLTSAQVKLLDYLCANCAKYINTLQLPYSRIDGEVLMGLTEMTLDDLLLRMGTQSRLKAESEINQLENMGLLMFHFPNRSGNWSLMQLIIKEKSFRIKPTVSAIRLYVKCQGSTATPFEYFTEDMASYYRTALAEALPRQPEDILAFIEDEVERCPIEHISIINAKDCSIDFPDGRSPTREELGNMIRPYIIKHQIFHINNSLIVKVNGKPFGEFNYKQGFTTLYRG